MPNFTLPLILLTTILSHSIQGQSVYSFPKLNSNGTPKSIKIFAYNPALSKIDSSKKITLLYFNKNGLKDSVIQMDKHKTSHQTFLWSDTLNRSRTKTYKKGMVSFEKLTTSNTSNLVIESHSTYYYKNKRTNKFHTYKEWNHENEETCSTTIKEGENIRIEKFEYKDDSIKIQRKLFSQNLPLISGDSLTCQNTSIFSPFEVVDYHRYSRGDTSFYELHKNGNLETTIKTIEKDGLKHVILESGPNSSENYYEDQYYHNDSSLKNFILLDRQKNKLKKYQDFYTTNWHHRMVTDLITNTILEETIATTEYEYDDYDNAIERRNYTNGELVEVFKRQIEYW